jgi:hypothetical protein
LGGLKGDQIHACINSRSGGGAAGAEPAQQQPRVEVMVRLDVWLPAALPPGRQALQMPSLNGTSAYRVFHRNDTYQGVGRGGRPAAQPISEADRFNNLHCGRCMKPLAEIPVQAHSKAVNECATYWVCWAYDEELRARRGQDSKAVWDCPTAAEGGSGCKCCTNAKMQQDAGKRPKSKGFSSPKKQ